MKTKCPLCNKKFWLFGELVLHMEFEHSQLIKKPVGKKCLVA
jgi:hypothetical protein